MMSAVILFIAVALYVSAAHADEIVIVDEAENFTQVLSASAGIAIATSNPARYGGDSSRFYKTTHDNEFLIYEAQTPLTRVYVESWYNKSGTGVLPGDMTFEVSADNVTYTPLHDVVKTVHNAQNWPVHEWRKVEWSASSLPIGTRYLKITFGGTAAHGSTFAIQIGKTRLTQAGIVAPPEPGRYEIAMTDDSSDFSKLLRKSDQVAVGTSNPGLFNGDGFRFYKTSHAEQFVVYESVTAITYFQARTWYNKNGAGVIPGDMSFEVSSDNLTYTPLAAVTKTVYDGGSWPANEWRQIDWTSSALPAGTKYVKMVFGQTTAHGGAYAIQIGETTIKREALTQAIHYALQKLDDATIGEQPGMYPASSAAELATAIQAAVSVAEDAQALMTELPQAYGQLLQSLKIFDDSFIYGIHWPSQAGLTVSGVGLDQFTIHWPQALESEGTEYRVYLNDAVATVTSDTYYTATRLRFHTEYRVQVVAVNGELYSRTLGPAAVMTEQISPIPAPDFSQIDVDDFSDEDYLSPRVWVNDQRSIPYYFAHFHTLANAVRLEQPNRGFIDIKVHRSVAGNIPDNARVQENHLWFAYFYTRQASWNLYYGMPEVKLLLEEVLEHLLTLQDDTGMFTQGNPASEHDRAGTSFAVHFLGQTVRMLNEATAADPNLPSIDDDLYDRVIEAYRKGILHVLDDNNDNGFWNHARDYTNQYTLLWSAVAAYLEYDPDSEIEQRMRQRFSQAGTEFISPAGFYYEGGGLDMSYNLGVHMQSMMADYFYFKNTDVEQELLEKEGKYIDWLSYNLVREPDGSHFTSNAAPSTRLDSSHIERKDIPLAEKLPLARAFVRTAEEAAAEVIRAKSKLAGEGWPNVPALQRNGNNAYNPYGAYNRLFNTYYPTEQERSAAVAMLPYLASERFNHQRVDDRSEGQFTYVRKPAYYAAFNAGQRQTTRQVFGLGLLWHPEGGIMLSSQTESTTSSALRDLSWGTGTGSERLYENRTLEPTYRINGIAVAPTVGQHDLPAGDVEVHYALGTAGEKTVTFQEDGIAVQIDHQGVFTEHLPLMIAPEDIFHMETGKATITRGDVVLEIVFDEEAAVQVQDKNYSIYKYRMHMLTLEASGELSYRIKLSVPQPQS